VKINDIDKNTAETRILSIIAHLDFTPASLLFLLRSHSAYVL